MPMENVTVNVTFVVTNVMNVAKDTKAIPNVKDVCAKWKVQKVAFVTRKLANVSVKMTLLMVYIVKNAKMDISSIQNVKIVNANLRVLIVSIVTIKLEFVLIAKRMS